MTDSQEQTQMTREQFELQTVDLAREFLAVLQGRRLSSGVVMQAAMEVHRCVARQMPIQAQGELSMAMAAYAGELMQGLPAFNPSQTTH